MLVKIIDVLFCGFRCFFHSVRNFINIIIHFPGCFFMHRFDCSQCGNYGCKRSKNIESTHRSGNAFQCLRRTACKFHNIGKTSSKPLYRCVYCRDAFSCCDHRRNSGDHALIVPQLLYKIGSQRNGIRQMICQSFRHICQCFSQFTCRLLCPAVL